MAFTLEANNTFVIRAKLYAQVAAKTWIWKGINFGLLGCLKIPSCHGEVVTYTANIDMELSIQVLLLDSKMSVRIKPVNTAIDNVNVQGCRPPWFLFWFKGWQDLLNKGIQEGFQNLADNYEKQTEVPEEFSPFPGVYIHYVITNLAWNPSYVMFGAKATFSASIHGRNVTFEPLKDFDSPSSVIPFDEWNMISLDDEKSHLLQGKFMKFYTKLKENFINFSRRSSVDGIHQ